MFADPLISSWSHLEGSKYHIVTTPTKKGPGAGSATKGGAQGSPKNDKSGGKLPGVVVKQNYYYVEIYHQNRILMIMFFQLKLKFSIKILNWLYMDEINFVTPYIFYNHNFKNEEFLDLLKKIFAYFKADLVFLDKNPRILHKSMNPLSLYKNINSETTYLKK